MVDSKRKSYRRKISKINFDIQAIKIIISVYVLKNSCINFYVDISLRQVFVSIYIV